MLNRLVKSTCFILLFSSYSCTTNHPKVELAKGIFSYQTKEDFKKTNPSAHFKEVRNNIQNAYLDFEFYDMKISAEITFCKNLLMCIDIHPDIFSNNSYRNIITKLNKEKSIDIEFGNIQYKDEVGYALIYDFIKPVLGHDTIIRLFHKEIDLENKVNYYCNCK
ncbi:hypothetical protein [Crocinitomix catalasitica]|uniref:hypothetical protein n=1 Tax=Crocinitomix catalasitica TaxID=184607 RepID=UPI000480B189|nr:hypothetical protein [Crocinitomix catalasitica]